MVNLNRNKRGLYLCKKKKNTLLYEKPEFYKINYQPATSISNMINAGEDYTMFLIATCTPEIAKNFSYNDRCYINVMPKLDDDFDGTCDDADYFVYGEPLCTLNEAVIKIRKLGGDLYEENQNQFI